MTDRWEEEAARAEAVQERWRRTDLMWPLHEVIGYIAEHVAGDAEQAAKLFVDAWGRGAINPRGHTSRGLPLRVPMGRELALECAIGDGEQDEPPTTGWLVKWRRETWYDIEVPRDEVTKLFPPKSKREWRPSEMNTAFVLASMALEHRQGLPDEGRLMLRQMADIAAELAIPSADKISEDSGPQRALARQIIDLIARLDRMA